MILILDNYDSFTFNLMQYIGEINPDLKVVRNDQLTVAEAIALKPTHIVVSPGPCTPSEAGISVDLIQARAAVHPFAGRMPGASGHGRSVRRQGHPRPGAHARQAVHHRVRLQGIVRGTAADLHRHALPFASSWKNPACPPELEITATCEDEAAKALAAASGSGDATLVMAMRHRIAPDLRAAVPSGIHPHRARQGHDPELPRHERRLR